MATSRSLNAFSGRRSEALEALLVDLGSQIQKGSARAVAEAPRWLKTGVAPLDRLLGGGFPIGRLSEICGPAEATASPAVAPSASAPGWVLPAVGGSLLGGFALGYVVAGLLVALMAAVVSAIVVGGAGAASGQPATG